MQDLSVVLIGTYPPRHDGLATFASDLSRSIAACPEVRVRVIAIDPPGETFRYGRGVVGRIRQGKIESYIQAAELVKRLRPDIVSVQHEFGLWGIWGEELEEDFTVPLIQAITAGDRPVPVISTLHTVRPSPATLEREVLRGIVEYSSATVVMARMGAILLLDDYGLSPDRIVHIPHGFPVIEQRTRRYLKHSLGLDGRTIVSTFGLLSPNKGIEYAIAAMEPVARDHPETLYLVAGETHPEHRKHYGEQYRNELHALVRDLNLDHNVSFVNQYLSDREIIDYLQASDIYVTPYLNRNQITSGTLSFAVGAGKAIVSTPYLHATEVLAEGRGILAEFRSAESLAHCFSLLLDGPEERRQMEERIRTYGRQDAWPSIGSRYVDLLRRVVEGQPLTDLLAVEPNLS